MRSRLRKKSLFAAAAATAALAAVPAEAAASHEESPIDAVATIAGCRGARLTIAAQIEPAANGANARALRAARHANLRMRFEAAPLYGPTRKSREFDLGRTTTARRSVRFGDLPAQSYSGIVRYRWVRGKRTVMSGLMRTQKARVAGRRGKAFCSLRVGKRPVDTTPPFIVPVPSDSGWKRGPLTVRFFVLDDLSGVALVVSRVDGGPFVRGRAITISGQDTHRLEYIARDAAENQTPPAAVTLRIDQGAPTQPTVTAPLSPTTDPTPEVRWNGSTDTASGVAGYVVLVRNSSGAIVWSQTVPAAARAATVGQELGLGNYTAEVVAFDGAAPQPFTATGTRAFTVVAPATPPPDSDGDGIEDPNDNCPNTANANQANFDGDSQGDACDTDDDNDGLSDTAETNTYGTNPFDPDSDNDTLTDGEEVHGSPPTNPNSPDTDGDGFNDPDDPCPIDPGLVDGCI